MEAFCVRGVVKNGQVLLAKPLDLPEGTVVTVEYEPALGEPQPITDEQFAELTGFLTGKRDKKEWPAFEARLKLAHGTP